MIRTRKKPTNLSIDAKLLAAARKQNLNLSTTLETALREKLREESERAWQKENASAIDAYVTHVESNGVFSDGLRRF
ncbi:MAG: type II toxin-antitoxin system CcdA family antitoxin [Clostridia bacterium]|nr:type II toxin-antitoxin system CcdA family antitoxin [Deltaproteobacteria bacterium]